MSQFHDCHRFVTRCDARLGPVNIYTLSCNYFFIAMGLHLTMRCYVFFGLTESFWLCVLWW